MLRLCHPLTPQAESCYAEVEVGGDWVDISLDYKGIDIFGETYIPSYSIDSLISLSAMEEMASSPEQLPTNRAMEGFRGSTVLQYEVSLQG